MDKSHQEQPSHFGGQTPYQIATTGNPDPRSRYEIFTDWSDKRLEDIFYSSGLVGAEHDKTYSPDEVMKIARAAYIQGANDASNDSKELIENIADEFGHKKQD